VRFGRVKRREVVSTLRAPCCLDEITTVHSGLRAIPGGPPLHLTAKKVPSMLRQMRETSRRVRAGALALAILGSMSGAGEAAAKRPTGAELSEDGLTDPRARPRPPRHRIRLALLSDYIRGSAARTEDGRVTRFHFAPLMIDVAYQLQFLKYLMIRPSFAIGGNVANTRNAMPGVIQPGIFTGYQGSLLGVAGGYTLVQPLGATIGIDNGHPGGLVQPVLDRNHAIQLELSLTTKVDRGALNFALRFGVVNSHLYHLDIDKKRWTGVLTLSAGWFFELGARKRRKQREAAAAQTP